MVFDKIKEIIAEQTGKDEDEVTMDTNIKDDLDIDSLDLFQIINDLEDEFGVDFGENTEFETVGDVVKFVEENQ